MSDCGGIVTPKSKGYLLSGHFRKLVTCLLLTIPTSHVIFQADSRLTQWTKDLAAPGSALYVVFSTALHVSALLMEVLFQPLYCFWFPMESSFRTIQEITYSFALLV